MVAKRNHTQIIATAAIILSVQTGSFISTMTDQEDGAYPRINGAMLQSQQYNGMIVSAVGRVLGPHTLQAADGTNITLDTDNVAEALVVNPEMCVEIIGSAQDATTLMVCPERRINLVHYYST